ncbi:MAG: hypothetical protein ABSA86_01530 [Oryzomonas sp.]|jgi:hypothetical protein
MLKRFFSCLTGVALIAGCGGGGGSSSPAGLPAAYTGKTTQATVTTANAKTLSMAAYNGSGWASAMGVVVLKAVASDSIIQPPLIQDVVGIIESSAATIAQQPKSSAKAVKSLTNTQNTVNGYSGSYSYNFNIDTVSGAVNGTETFSQYQASSNSLTMSGTVTLSGVFNMVTSTFSSMNMTMTNLNITAGSSNITLSGNLAASTSGSTTTETFTFATTDNVTHLTTLAYNYTMMLTGTSLTFAGTYYDPAEGYLTVSTVTPLTVASLSDTPTAGQLLFTGSNGTKARLTFSSVGTTVEADTAGNGTFVVVP